MREELDVKLARFEELERLLADPVVLADSQRMSSVAREHGGLARIVRRYQAFLAVEREILEYTEMLTGDDTDFRELAAAELPGLEKRRDEEWDVILDGCMDDPDADRSRCIVELRAGTGGDEASIFAGDLFRMYSKYCESKGWKVDVVDFSEGTNGGFKEIQFEVSGEDVYGTLKFEAGVHRVQRVPQTETQGRVHTSAATVMVFPEAEEFDVVVNPKDVRIDFFCSSGPGGQSVNTTYSAVRLTHIPTGLVAQCQDQKSQHKNKEKAFRVLRSRLYEMELAKKNAEDALKRGSMVTSGDRSAKIRTYNYSQGRVTDHRIGLTLYDLSNIVNGDIQRIIDELQLAENTEKLKANNDVI